MALVTYNNKIELTDNPNVSDINKIRAEDMNEIKDVINNNFTASYSKVHLLTGTANAWILTDNTIPNEFTGMLINIIVPATNTSNALTLKINDGESKPVGLKTGGVGINSYSLQEGTLQTLYYDGTSWIINHQPNATTLNEGLVKLSSSTSLSSNNLAATPGAVKNVNDSLVALETLVAGKKIHYTSIQTSENPSRKMCKNGFNSGTSCGHTSWEKYGEGNNMSEFYGGIFIPNIEDYSFIVAELNFGGNTAVSTQINGGIVLYTDKIGTPDSIYGEGWREYLLTPPTNNYVKVTQTKLIAVGNRTGEHVIGSVWDTYSGTVNIWGGGFGTTGCTLRVIAFTK